MKLFLGASLAVLLGVLFVTEVAACTLKSQNRVLGLRNLPDNRQSHAFCNVRGKLAVLGGRGNAKNAYFYNGVTNRWENFKKLPDNISRIHHVQCAPYKNGLVIGGGYLGEFPFETPARDIYYWDLKSKSIAVLGKIQENRARGSSAMVVRQGLIYIFGGTTRGHGRGIETTKKWCDRFNPDNNQWRTLAGTRVPRDHAGAVYDLDSDRAYLAGGRLGGAREYYLPKFAYKTVEVYSFKQDKWTDLKDNTVAVHPGSTPTICGRLLVIAGGEVDKRTKDSRVDQTEVYNLNQGEWKMRSGGLSTVKKFADRHASPLVACNGVIYRVAGAQRFPFALGDSQNKARSQMEALLLNGEKKNCKPSSFWRGVQSGSGPDFGTARFFSLSGATPPPIETPEPIETTEPEVTGRPKEGIEVPKVRDMKPVDDPDMPNLPASFAPFFDSLDDEIMFSIF